MLFAGENYYPRGGMNDFIDYFDTKKEAIKWVRKNVNTLCSYHQADIYDVWYNILDLEEV